MSSSLPCLNASEAAKRLGVSIKALRLYEQQGLVSPSRTGAGYRAYGPDDMCRAAEVVALLAMSVGVFGLAQIPAVAGERPMETQGQRRA